MDDYVKRQDVIRSQKSNEDLEILEGVDQRFNSQDLMNS